MSAPGPLAWGEMMRLGLGRLGLGAEVFWAMTPGEFLAALEGAGILAPPGAALTRAGLTRLMAEHPDLTQE